MMAGVMGKAREPLHGLSRLGLAAALLGSSAALSGCVVATVPVLAGGLVVKKVRDDRSVAPAARASARQSRETTPTAVAPVPRPVPVNVSEMQPGVAYAGLLPPPWSAASDTTSPVTATLPLPADLSTMRPGIAYAGALPPPGGTATKAPTPAPSPFPTSAKATWADVGHYVAGLASATPARSALLLRGGTPTQPAWAPCAAKPKAVLASLDTIATPNGSGGWKLAGEARQWLDVLQTLEIRAIVTGSAPATAAPAIRSAFGAAGLGKLLGDGELRLGVAPAAMLNERAEVAARSCVLAVIGREATDFPNNLLPGATPPALQAMWGAGWFLVPR